MVRRYSKTALVLAIVVLSSPAIAQTTTFTGTHASTLDGMNSGGGAEVAINQTGATTATYRLVLGGDIFGAMPPGGVVLNMNGTLAGNVWTFTTPATHPILGDQTFTLNQTTGMSTGSGTGISAFGRMFTMTGSGNVAGLGPRSTMNVTHQIFEVGNPVAVGGGMINAVVGGPTSIPTLGVVSQILLAGLLILTTLALLRRTVAG